MPRQVRIEYPGAFYHVMARGNRREPIVFDDTDRKTFLRTLGEACERAFTHRRYKFQSWLEFELDKAE